MNLRFAIPGQFVQAELYHSRRQETGKYFAGHSLEEEIERAGHGRRLPSLGHFVVKEWLSDPDSYPFSFRDKDVILWGSKKVFRGGRVPVLRWRRDGITTRWRYLSENFGANFHTLLFYSSPCSPAP